MAAGNVTASGFSEAERAAMKERAAEMRNEGRGGKKKAEEAQALLDKLEEMSEPDKTLGERVHAIVTEVAPDLEPKTWYGMPAWARDGKVVLFFKPAEKFGSRYATLGFSDLAKLDDGAVWATEFAVTDLGKAEEKQVRALVAKAVG